MQQVRRISTLSWVESRENITAIYQCTLASQSNEYNLTPTIRCKWGLSTRTWPLHCEISRCGLRDGRCWNKCGQLARSVSRATGGIQTQSSVMKAKGIGDASNVLLGRYVWCLRSLNYRNRTVSAVWLRCFRPKEARYGLKRLAH